MHPEPDICARPSSALRLFDLSGRVALVTGGTRGLGLEIARALSSAGAAVVVVSRKEAACAQVAAELRAGGGRALGYPCHVGRWSDLERLVDTAYGTFERVDVLVNCAGVSPLYPSLAACSEELFDKVVAVNLKGPFRLSALVGERMAAGDGGSIINVSSTGAVRASGEPIEAATRSDVYFDVVAHATRARARTTGAAEEISRRCLHLLNLPAGTDVRRVREQLARMERRIAALSDEIADLEHGRDAAAG